MNNLIHNFLGILMVMDIIQNHYFHIIIIHLFIIIIIRDGPFGDNDKHFFLIISLLLLLQLIFLFIFKFLFSFSFSFNINSDDISKFIVFTNNSCGILIPVSIAHK